MAQHVSKDHRFLIINYGVPPEGATEDEQRGFHARQALDAWSVINTPAKGTVFLSLVRFGHHVRELANLGLLHTYSFVANQAPKELSPSRKHLGEIGLRAKRLHEFLNLLPPDCVWKLDILDSNKPEIRINSKILSSGPLRGSGPWAHALAAVKDALSADAGEEPIEVQLV